MCERAGGSTIKDRLVEWFLKKFLKSFVTFEKSVITGSRGVNLLPFKMGGKEAGIYGKFTGADRDSAGDQHCGEEPCGEADED